MREEVELNKAKSITQKQKELEEEKKLIPVFNPSNLATTSSKEPNSVETHDQRSTSIPSASPKQRPVRKVKHRAHIIQPNLNEPKSD